jgi:hypothetical protein
MTKKAKLFSLNVFKGYAETLHCKSEVAQIFFKVLKSNTNFEQIMLCNNSYRISVIALVCLCSCISKSKLIGYELDDQALIPNRIMGYFTLDNFIQNMT